MFVLERGDCYVVTDYGEAMGWLRQHSVSDRLTKNQQSMVDDVCHTLRLDLTRGQLTRRGVGIADLANAIVEVAQASVRVADVWFTMRSQPTQPTADRVD